MMFKAWDHTSLAVDDLDLSMEFYRKTFGYALVFAERGMAKEIRSMMGLARLTCDLGQMSHPLSGQRLELIAFRGHDAPPQSHPLAAGAGHIGFEVENLDAALAVVVANGAVPIGAVTDFPEGRSTYCREPGGSFFELSEMNEEPPA